MTFITTILPTPPNRGDAPAQFNAAADLFLGSFGLFQSELNAFIAALPTLVSGVDYNGTSTTSVAVGTGAKTFTTQTGKNFQIGQFVVVANTAAPANFMSGQVTAYNTATGSITVEVASTGGSGTLADWTISLAPTAGSYATLAGIETLTNKSLTTPVLTGTASGITAGRLGYLSGVLTFGDGTAERTLVTTDNTQTLTNKTFNAGVSSNVLKVNGNTIAATAGTATLTFPNSSDTMVGRATTDTLTNKTLTSPTINSPTMTGGTWGTASITSGSVITDASATGGAKFRLTPGVAPTTPTNGDMWLTAAALFARIGGATLQLGTLRVDGSNMTAAKGYIKLTDGTVKIMVAWSTGSCAAGGSVAVTFDQTFSSTPFAIPGNSSGLNFSGTLSTYISSGTLTSSGCTLFANNGGGVTTTVGVLAIGSYT